MTFHMDRYYLCVRDLRAAEERVKVLEAALREIDHEPALYPIPRHHCRIIARAALAADQSEGHAKQGSEE